MHRLRRDILRRVRIGVVSHARLIHRFIRGRLGGAFGLSRLVDRF
jgi:hypothetical protein